MLSKYEIGFIVTPEANDEEIKKIIDAITTILKKAKAVIENIDEWGRKKMAYPIQKNEEGYYVFIATEVDGETIAVVERRIRQLEKVMRFTILRLDERLKKSNKLVKRWKKTDLCNKRHQEVKEPTGTEPASPVAEEEVKNAE